MSIIHPDRPAAYRKNNPISSPWLLALRRLWEKGWSDQTIAEALCDLSSEAISWCERKQRWREQYVRKMLMPQAGELWTRRQVAYWRGVLGLRGRRPRHERGYLSHLRQTKHYDHARRMGWGHLGPLTPAELAVLEALSDGEPKGSRELEALTGYCFDRRRTGRQGHALRRLVDRQIVSIVQLGYGGNFPLYSLMPGIQRRDPEVRPTEAYYSLMRAIFVPADQ